MSEDTFPLQLVTTGEVAELRAMVDLPGVRPNNVHITLEIATDVAIMSVEWPALKGLGCLKLPDGTPPDTIRRSNPVTLPSNLISKEWDLQVSTHFGLWVIRACEVPKRIKPTTITIAN